MSSTSKSKDSNLIVKIKNASFKYTTNYFDVSTYLNGNPFSGKKHPLILENISISVPKGTIYALLGSNGCGKFKNPIFINILPQILI